MTERGQEDFLPPLFNTPGIRGWRLFPSNDYSTER
jgi:hypothetical protein